MNKYAVREINTSTKVLQMDFEEVFFIFVIFQYRISLYRWKKCSIVYFHVKCQLQPITRKPTALLSYQHKCEHKPTFDAHTMFINFKINLFNKITNKQIHLV